MENEICTGAQELRYQAALDALRNGERVIRHQYWRVRGVPLGLSSDELIEFFQRHPALRVSPSPSTARSISVEGGQSGNWVHVQTLAPDLQYAQTATICFDCPPSQLNDLDSSGQLVIDLAESKRDRDPAQNVQLTIDRHFKGITVLYSPSKHEHQLDILAISGLGSHAFGSFVHKGDGNMWLSGNLSRDLPQARIMIFGYESGLQQSSSFSQLDDMARALRISTCQLIRCSNRRPIVLIGHSLGGLLIKEALCQMAASGSEAELLHQVYGALFFGVPNDGMDIESLIPIVGHQPNRLLLESLNAMNSEILRSQKQKFSTIFKQSPFDLYCFYETRLSPTAVKDATGQYKMNGPLRCLVSTTSAISCLPSSVSSTNAMPIDRTHSELVKFAVHDEEYDKVRYILQQLYLKAHKISSTDAITGDMGKPLILLDEGGSQATSPSYIPFQRNKHFVGRKKILDRLKHQLFEEKSCQTVGIVGLGGVGKTQIALALALWVKANYTNYSILWISVQSKASFQQTYTELAKRLGLRPSDPNEDIKELVREHLSSEAAGRWLMVVDNADDIEDMYGDASEAGGLSQPIPESESGLTIFTTRSREVAVNVAGPNVIELHEMEHDEAVEFLSKTIIGKENLSNEKLVTTLLRELTYLPLAISQAVAYVNTAQISIERYLELLHGTEKEMIRVLSREFYDRTRYRNSQNAVATTWLVNFEQIQKMDSGAAELLVFISCIQPKAIMRSLLPPLLSQEQKEFAIGTLRGYGFLTNRDEENIFDMHNLVHKGVKVWVHRDGWNAEAYTSALRHVHCEVTNSFVNGDREKWVGYLPHALQLLYSSRSFDAIERFNLLDTIGLVLIEERRFQEAIQCLEEVVTWRRIHYIETNPMRLDTEFKLASAYISNRRIKETIELLEKMLTVAWILPEQLILKNQARQMLGNAYLMDRRIEEALNILEDAVEAWREVSPEHMDYESYYESYRLNAEEGLANAYLAHGRIQAAIKVFERVVEIKQGTLSEEHHSRLNSEHLLGTAYLLNGQHDESIIILEAVRNLRKTALLETDLDRLSTDQVLASAYLKKKRVKEAIQMLEAIVKAEEKILPEKDHSRLTSQHELAYAYLLNKQIKEAIICLEHVVRVQKEILPENDPNRTNSESLLQTAYHQYKDENQGGI